MNVFQFIFPSAFGVFAVIPLMCFLPETDYFTNGNRFQVWNTMPWGSENTQGGAA